MNKLDMYYDGATTSEETLQHRIATHVRGMIQSQALRVGDRLPPTKALAEQWAADIGTVHLALRRLVTEGYIARVQGRGTFVRDRATKLTTVGLLVDSQNHQVPHFSFKSQLTYMIRQILLERGLAEMTFVDSRPIEERNEPLPEMLEQARAGRIQGLLQLCGGVDSAVLGRKLPVPLIAAGDGAKEKNLQYMLIVEQGMQHLAKSGCRAVGVIQEHYVEGVDRDFAVMADGFGLRWSSDWYLHPALYGMSTETAVKAEHFGYQAFHHLWRQDDRPDGLVVLFDHPSRGVLMAIGELGCRVPRELELVLYRNEGIDYFCPHPVAYVDLKISKLAAQFVNKLEAEVEGRTCPSPSVLSVMELVPAALQAHLTAVV